MGVLHNENSRVKIPALVHLTRLDYEYISIKKYQGKIDKETNIFVDEFLDAVNKLNNSNLSLKDIKEIIKEINIRLSNNDLGKDFYSILKSGYKGLKLLDLTTPNGEKNTYKIVTELIYKNGNDEFRPDITILINGLPLAFIEVKKPNNKDGIQAEYDRINNRFKKEKLRKFVNITQLMIFSNNCEYDENDIVPLEGAFYASSSYIKLFFNHFREEDKSIFLNIKSIDEQKEKEILKDTNLVTIKHTPEYATNLSPETPTNRILTSLFSHKRIMFILKYGIAYVEKTDENGITILEKQIMRYPQIFATKAIEKRLNTGTKNGIIWHTQGSGKTALVYYNVKYLKDYYQRQGIIVKFYFIVDRLDLLTQAADEFRSRGLYVEEVNSKKEFISNIQTTGTNNNMGKDTITVVNIQKFSEESISKESDYNVNVQRIYFLDEAHRSYKPIGSFLTNLIMSDRKAVMIALTGTPLIGEGYNTKDVFGAYIHKYYYNRSIADGYTLRLLREGIETTYKKKLKSALDEIKTIKGSISKMKLYSHPKYVSALVKYICTDFSESRFSLDDQTIGGMIVCDSSEQARVVFDEMKKSEYSSALILHNEGNANIRRKKRDEFKKGQIDFLIVYNMLLTGFDVPRLKKLYLGRIIKNHSLLQALTRVNRPYNKFRYGYIVDFADIRAEFDKTNKAYFEELQTELGDEFKQYNNIFKTPEEIERDLKYIKETLFLYNTSNAEIFSQQISILNDKKDLLDLRYALELYKELYNIAKLFDYEELSNKFDLKKIKDLYNEVVNRINLINFKQIFNDAKDMSKILALALDEIDFQFKKISENELIVADKFRNILEKTHHEMQINLDTKDPEYVTLLEELQRLLKMKNIEELNGEEMSDYIIKLEKIKKDVKRKNLVDRMLIEKYENDPKFMRVHKRLKENSLIKITDRTLRKVLIELKHTIDNKVLSNVFLLDNVPYFTQDLFPLIRKELEKNDIHFTIPEIKNINTYIVNEYINERNWIN